MNSYVGESQGRFGSQTANRIDKVHSRVESRLQEAILETENVLIHAEPGTGKTYSTFKVISKSTGDFTYVTSREDLYDQAIDNCKEFGIQYQLVPSPYRGCPCFDSDDHRYTPEANNLYKLGVFASIIHDKLDLPCNSECKYMREQESFDQEANGVIIGHYKHLYRTSIVTDRTVFVDEWPGQAFETDFSSPSKIMNPFIENTDGIPFKHYTDLRENEDHNRERKVYDWFRDNDGITTDEIGRAHV